MGFVLFQLAMTIIVVANFFGNDKEPVLWRFVPALICTFCLGASVAIAICRTINEAVL